jgi:hypothetical protein
MQAVAQRLIAKRIPMVEFNQTVGNLTEASTNLYDLIKGRNLVAYPDAEMRLAVQRSVAVETPRGWRITKEKASHKIDVVVALAQAALGAVQEAGQPSISAKWRAAWGNPDTTDTMGRELPAPSPSPVAVVHTPSWGIDRDFGKVAPDAPRPAAPIIHASKN